MADSIRIGCVKYLNARPLIDGWPGEVLFDHPAALCGLLERGELDVALVSSFEYLRNPIYKIVDRVSISSAGAVYSVFVAFAGELDDLREVQLDPASRTSVNLLRCLLGELQMRTRLTSEPVDDSEPLKDGIGRLLIGDQAIRFRQRFGDRYRYFDLGEQWQQLTALPFVYALWLVRPELKEASVIARRLRRQRDQNLSRLGELSASQDGFDPTFCRYYYEDCLRFGFDDRERHGLTHFQTLCGKHKILPARQLRIELI